MRFTSKMMYIKESDAIRLLVNNDTYRRTFRRTCPLSSE